MRFVMQLAKLLSIDTHQKKDAEVEKEVVTRIQHLIHSKKEEQSCSDNS